MKKIVCALTGLALSIFAASTSFADISTAQNYYQFSDNVLTSGQPKQTLLESAAEDGIEVVINLVPTHEGIYNPNEGEILKKQGIEYFHNPVSWSAPKEAELASFLKIMEKYSDKKVLVHCWSNARASALVYAHRVSQNPETKEAELARLKKVWSDIAGYNLERSKTWTDFLDKNVTASN